MLQAAEEATEVDGVAVSVADGGSVCMAILHTTGGDFTDEAYETFEARRGLHNFHWFPLLTVRDPFSCLNCADLFLKLPSRAIPREGRASPQLQHFPTSDVHCSTA